MKFNNFSELSNSDRAIIKSKMKGKKMNLVIKIFEKDSINKIKMIKSKYSFL